MAIKQIYLYSISAENIRSIESEINLLKKLDHPNIVKYIECIQTKTHINLVLEYVEGGSLHYILKQSGKMGEHLVFIFVKQILEGLVYLHNQGIIHRDIKGANLLLTKNGIIKLADFGYSILNDKNKVNSLVGTACWMAPEVIEQKGNISPKCDIWSLGSTIIQLLTTQPPYYEFDAMQAMFRIVQDKCPPLPNDISDNLRDFLLKCFEKDPEKRLSAKELLFHPWLTQPNKKLVKKFISDNDSSSAIPESLINEWKNNYRENLASITSNSQNNDNLSPKTNSYENINNNIMNNVNNSNNNNYYYNAIMDENENKKMFKFNNNNNNSNNSNNNSKLLYENNYNDDNNNNIEHAPLIQEINLLYKNLDKIREENILKEENYYEIINNKQNFKDNNNFSIEIKSIINDLISLNFSNNNNNNENDNYFKLQILLTKIHFIFSHQQNLIPEFLSNFNIVQIINIFNSSFINKKNFQLLINILIQIINFDNSFTFDLIIYQTLMNISKLIYVFSDIEIIIEIICLIYYCIENKKLMLFFLSSGGIYLLNNLINVNFLKNNNEIILSLSLDFIIYFFEILSFKNEEISLFFINNKLLMRLNLILIEIFSKDDFNNNINNNNFNNNNNNEINDLYNIIIERIFTILFKITMNKNIFYLISNDKILITLIEISSQINNNQIENFIKIFDNIMKDINNLNILENLGYIETLLKFLNNFVYNNNNNNNNSEDLNNNNNNNEIINKIINQIFKLIKLNKARSDLFVMSEGIDILCSLAKNNKENSNDDYINKIVEILCELINSSDFSRMKLKQSKTLSLIVKLLIEKKEINVVKELFKIILDWYSEDRFFIEDYIFKENYFFEILNNLNIVVGNNINEYLSILNDLLKESEEIENKFFDNNVLVANAFKKIENNNNFKDIHLLNKIMDFLELFMKNKSNDKNFLDKCNFQKILNKIIQISKEKKLIIIDEKIKKILNLNENNTTN